MAKIEQENKMAEFEKGNKRIEAEKAQHEFEIKLLENEAQKYQPSTPKSHSDSGTQFDAARNIRLVPKFFEKNVDKYFPQFGVIATSLKWPKEVRTVLLQSALIGKATEVYSSLSVAQRQNYDIVKDHILKAYELVPEAYRQTFRGFKKLHDQTHVEFARQKVQMFERWLHSKNIGQNFDNLRELILLEQFKSCIHSDIKTHIDDQHVDSLNDAAVMAVINKTFIFKARSRSGVISRKAN